MTIVGHLYASHPSTRFMLHDLVSCDWNCTGRVTVHEIVAIQRCVHGCQTGTLFKVSPPVHPPERGSAYAQGWIDAAWFFKDGLEIA